MALRRRPSPSSPCLPHQHLLDRGLCAPSPRTRPPKGSCPGKRLPQALLDTAVSIGSDPGVWQEAQQTSPG